MNGYSHLVLVASVMLAILAWVGEGKSRKLCFSCAYYLRQWAAMAMVNIYGHTIPREPSLISSLFIAFSRSL
ncbi:hypothetical protein BC939DRAFT_461351, partial [Gamsiella multidivaricata]